MPKYIVYELEAVENLKLAKTNMQIDSQDSMDYVSGSAMRGAFIYKYIRANNVNNINEGEHREKLLAGNIKFLNAYPIKNKERSIPLPKCYFAPKEKIKAFDKELDIYLGLDSSLPQGYEKIKLCEFVSINGNEYTKINVEKVSNLHINKLNEKNKLFRYESIKKGQEFAGIIKIEKEEYVKEVVELLENQIVYIGGSKGSGYGKCIVKNLEVLDENPEITLSKLDKDTCYIYIIALSDIIYKDNLGLYRTKIDDKFLKKVLQLDKVEFIDSSIETKNITSFNNKWNARTPNIVSIKAGSIFKYRIEGTLDKSSQLIDNGIGERKIDGYGRIAITTELDNAVIKEGTEEIDNVALDYCLTKDEQTLLNSIGERIYKTRIENKIYERVLDLDKNLENSKALKSSQWGSLKDLFSDLSQLDIERGKEKYNTYMKHNVSKRGTSISQMRQVKYVIKDIGREIKKDKLPDFLDEFMNNITDKTNFENAYKDCKIDIEDANIEINDEFIYRTNLKVLSELCRYQIRREERQ
ncbi:CRISPR-associated protein Csx10 [Proteiniborus ethanoligenes]|uniref:CRISPR-associated protein Csx10 n=1 Tax=Proteiniborus ethanoligenes TaxID=415015 RepID=A0A1H3SDP6_9FIRM|nr:RAMP superfamily CRISPR-associated protein [Proteiniborus ethanoligenes]SDZ35681.1 CRISPR-associated protein Csx10 [Proteiniborus ethanoligenes]